MTTITRNGLTASYDVSGDIMHFGIRNSQRNLWEEETDNDAEYDFLWSFIEESSGKIVRYTGTEILDWEDEPRDTLLDYISRKTGWNVSTLKSLAHDVYEPTKHLPHEWESLTS